MSPSPDFRHSDSSTANRTPGWIIDLIPGGPEASTAFEDAQAAYLAADQVAQQAALPVGQERKKLSLGLAGASNAALDAAVAERDRTAAELASAKRARDTARHVLVRLIEGKSPETEALISRIAGENVVADRERAVGALDVLRSAFRQIDEYVTYAPGLVTHEDSYEMELLLSCREAGFTPEAAARVFRKQGLVMPGWDATVRGRARKMHAYGVSEPLAAIEAALAAVPTAPAALTDGTSQ